MCCLLCDEWNGISFFFNQYFCFELRIMLNTIVINMSKDNDSLSAMIQSRVKYMSLAFS